MLIIPEIETVVIFVPRTGSGSLRRALQARYPSSMLLYRHMEADGVPHGYDQWTRVGVIRNPLDRLWSLYKFCRDNQNDTWSEHAAYMRKSADRPFSEWLMKNEVPFSTPSDRSDAGRFLPFFAVRHALPENKKSQRLHLRPDLGTHIFPFECLHRLAAALGVELGHQNKTEATPPPPIEPEVMMYMDRMFRWDYDAHEAALKR